MAFYDCVRTLLLTFGFLHSETNLDKVQSSDKFQLEEFYRLTDLLARRIAAIHPVTTVCNKSRAYKMRARIIPNKRVSSVLSFGCATVNIKSFHIKELEKMQRMLIKAALKLSKRSRNTSLLRALNVKKVKYILGYKQLNLYKNCLLNTLRARAFIYI